MATKKPATESHTQTSHDGFCSWHANGKRCRYPGSLSHSTNGSGPWYCRYHLGCMPVIGAQIVDESQEYKPVTKGDQEREHSEAVARSLKGRGLEQTPAETRAQWINRLRAYTNTGLSSMTRRAASKQSAIEHWERVLVWAGVGSLSERYATEALGILRKHVREPGEDELEAA